MTLTTKELVYPVITICRKGMLEYRGDEDILTTATKHELKIGWFNQMTIVDSLGRAVGVKDARYISGKGRFWGYTICLNRIIKLELTLDDNVWKMPFQELKKKVMAFARKSGQSMVPSDAREMSRSLAKAETVRELIELFQPYNDMKSFYETLQKI